MPIAQHIAEEEEEHEKELIGLIDEERMKYTGAMVRGLSDALVELTGTLAGLTLSLLNTRLIAMVGLIIGIAASLSMAGSEYLATKSEEGIQNPRKAAFYTALAYILTVLFLIFPYLIFTNVYFSLGLTIFNAVIIILLFTFYMSVAKEISFRERFREMILISLGIAAISFAIGFLIRKSFHIEV